MKDSTKRAKKLVRQRFPAAFMVKQDSGAYVLFEHCPPILAATKWLGWGHNRAEAWERAANGLHFWDR